MSDAGISYLTAELDRAILYCVDEFDMNCAEILGTLRLATAEVEADCLNQNETADVDEEEAD